MTTVNADSILDTIGRIPVVPEVRSLMDGLVCVRVSYLHIFRADLHQYHETTMMHAAEVPVHVVALLRYSDLVQHSDQLPEYKRIAWLIQVARLGLPIEHHYMSQGHCEKAARNLEADFTSPPKAKSADWNWRDAATVWHHKDQPREAFASELNGAREDRLLSRLKTCETCCGIRDPEAATSDIPAEAACICPAEAAAPPV